MNKTLSIVAITTNDYYLTNKAIDYTLHSLYSVDIDISVIILSDYKFREDCVFHKIPKINAFEYNRIALKELRSYVKTDFCLIVQYDGFAVDQNKWSPTFFEYDYIGAPWNDKQIGNGGFSLRSKKLLEACADTKINLDTSIKKGGNEDVIICRKHRKYLEEKYKIKFAPFDIAKNFSTESLKQNKNTLGFHAIWNVPYFLNEVETIDIIQNVKLNKNKFKRLVNACKVMNYKKALNYLNQMS